MVGVRCVSSPLLPFKKCFCEVLGHYFLLLEGAPCSGMYLEHRERKKGFENSNNTCFPHLAADAIFLSTQFLAGPPWSFIAVVKY